MASGAIVDADAAVTGDALAFVSEPFDTTVSVEGLISGRLDVTVQSVGNVSIPVDNRQ